MQVVRDAQRIQISPVAICLTIFEASCKPFCIYCVNFPLVNISNNLASKTQQGPLSVAECVEKFNHGGHVNCWRNVGKISCFGTVRK